MWGGGDGGTQGTYSFQSSVFSSSPLSDHRGPPCPLPRSPSPSSTLTRMNPMQIRTCGLPLAASLKRSIPPLTLMSDGNLNADTPAMQTRSHWKLFFCFFSFFYSGLLSADQVFQACQRSVATEGPSGPCRRRQQRRWRRQAVDLSPPPPSREPRRRPAATCRCGASRFITAMRRQRRLSAGQSSLANSWLGAPPAPTT